MRLWLTRAIEILLDRESRFRSAAELCRERRLKLEQRLADLRAGVREMPLPGMERRKS